MQAETTITGWAIVSAFGGAVVGASLGALTSYLLQRQALRAAKVLHDGDRKDLRKAQGYALLFKMIRLCSDLTQLGTPVARAVEKAKQENNSVGPLWPVVMPVLPQCDPIKFSAEEMALVLSLDGNLFNEMAALDDLHKSAIGLFHLYANKRDALTSTLQPTTVTGNVGTILLTKEDSERIKPHSVELDMIIVATIERTTKDGKIAWDCLQKLHLVLEREFDLKHKLELKEEYRHSSAEGQPYYHHYKS